jgi:hypothetical protein
MSSLSTGRVAACLVALALVTAAPAAAQTHAVSAQTHA